MADYSSEISANSTSATDITDEARLRDSAAALSNTTVAPNTSAVDAQNAKLSTDMQYYLDSASGKNSVAQYSAAQAHGAAVGAQLDPNASMADRMKQQAMMGLGASDASNEALKNERFQALVKQQALQQQINSGNMAVVQAKNMAQQVNFSTTEGVKQVMQSLDTAKQMLDLSHKKRLNDAKNAAEVANITKEAQDWDTVWQGISTGAQMAAAGTAAVSKWQSSLPEGAAPISAGSATANNTVSAQTGVPTYDPNALNFKPLDASVTAPSLVNFWAGVNSNDLFKLKY